MNKERVLQVADAIESRAVHDLGFNMCFTIVRTGEGRMRGHLVRDVTGRNCGTIACIAGWTHVVGEGGVLPEGNLPNHNTLEYAREWLDLDDKEAAQLFMALCQTWRDDAFEEPWPEIDEITDVMAVRTLRHLAETGVVEWNLP